MERFVDDLPDGEERALLSKVLSWAKPFRNFKNALLDMSELREQWFEFQRQELHEMVREWLEDNGVEAELVGNDGKPL